MANRTSIINALILHISSAATARGYRGLRFLHEINDWPSFYIHPKREARIHLGDGTKLGLILCDLRAYDWSDNTDNVEDLARVIENAIQTFRLQHLNLVQEARVLSVGTDEGLFQPYNITDIRFEVLYDIDAQAIIISITVDSTLITVDSNLYTVDIG